MDKVALLAEGVDRNTTPSGKSVDAKVALLAEGVDRNTLAFSFLLLIEGRPPRGGRG